MILLHGLLCEVNHLLTCGMCGRQCYVRNYITHIDNPDLVIRYDIRCRYASCKHEARSKHSAMEAETLFERK